VDGQIREPSWATSPLISIMAHSCSSCQNFRPGLKVIQAVTLRSWVGEVGSFTKVKLAA
jgi:hypothetical protein